MNSLGYLDVFLRLGAAVLAGAIIGFDREVRKKPAGLRTMALVALGSAVFVVATASAATVDSASVQARSSEAAPRNPFADSRRPRRSGSQRQ